MTKEFGDLYIYYSKDESGFPGSGRQQEKLQPEQLNTRLRNLYGELQQKLSSGPDQTIREAASETARKQIESLKEPLKVKHSMMMQQHLFTRQAQFASARAILEALKAGIMMSKTTPYYQEYLLQQLLETTIHEPEFYREYPMNIDNPRYFWGVGKPGTTGIFALDTAFPLEAAAYQSQRMDTEFANRAAYGGPPTTPYGIERYTKFNTRMAKWKTAMEEKYGPVPDIDSLPLDFRSFYG